MAKKKLGLIVNPIAGIGGRVGLHGSDGPEIQQRALALGGVAEANNRTVEALSKMRRIKDEVEIVTYPAEMGETAARESGSLPYVIGSIQSGATTAQDTRNAAEAMLRLNVDLMLFAGGDGTARDICDVLGDKLTVLGVPAGVKIHSAVFAVNARSAGELALRYLHGEFPRTREAEVIDVAEESFRQGIISTRLYGYLRIPLERRLTQGAKEPSPASERESLEGIAAEVTGRMSEEALRTSEDCLYIVGPGTTTRAITSRLGVGKTLVGVDVLHRGKAIASDVSEQDLIRLVAGHRAKIIITPIGGQGYLFGRGNQQISPRVIRLVGRDNVVVVATPDKIHSLRGRPLLVDTGDEQVDKMLEGYIRIVTGYREEAVYRVSS